jgi:hypothetical protein
MSRAQRVARFEAQEAAAARDVVALSSASWRAARDRWVACHSGPAARVCGACADHSPTTERDHR